jgi:GNAT superfamily N-acetyltransferase
VNVCDWRDADARILAPLYEDGRRRWTGALGWDTSGAWRNLEEARTTWGLPGLLAVDDAGRVQGWTYFLAQDDLLQVGGLAAESPLATRALVETLVQISGDAGMRGVSCFMFDEAPTVGDALGRLGFEIEPFEYLSRAIALASMRDLLTGADGWRHGDAAAAGALLHASYGPETARHIAPGHTPAAWERYVRNLVEQTGLGTFNPTATRVVRGAGGIDALALVTALSPETAHIAQVAVRSSRRGEGLATALVEDACARAAEQGHTRATLLVGSSNTAARRLYDRLGFAPGPRFLAARRVS